MAAAGGQRRHDDFGRPRRLGLAAAIGEAHDAVGLGDIDVTRVRPRRIEGDAERAVEPVGEDGGARRLGRAVGGAEHGDAAGAALGDEDVAVRRDAHDARLLEAGGEQADGEALRAPSARRPRGAATRHDGLAAERDAPAAGKSASVSLRRTPGASLRQSPKAAAPVRVPASSASASSDDAAIRMLARTRGGRMPTAP